MATSEKSIKEDTVSIYTLHFPEESAPPYTQRSTKSLDKYQNHRLLNKFKNKKLFKYKCLEMTLYACHYTGSRKK